MEVVEQHRRVAVGLNELARKLGCSRGHLSLVIHGHRKSMRMTERLRKMGIDLLAAPAEKREEAGA